MPKGIIFQGLMGVLITRVVIRKMGARLAGSKMTTTRSGGFLRYLELECSLPMSILSGYGVADESHVAMFSNFDGICVSDNLRLEPSAGDGGLNHHNVDNSGGLDIEHLVKLNMEARHAGRRWQLPEVMIFRST